MLIFYDTDVFYNILKMYKITKAIPLIFLIFLLNNCQNGQFFKRSDVKDNPVNVEERIQKNIDEGRGVRFGKTWERKRWYF